jgi:hypothetical protein
MTTLRNCHQLPELRLALDKLRTVRHTFKHFRRAYVEGFQRWRGLPTTAENRFQ